MGAQKISKSQLRPKAKDLLEQADTEAKFILKKADIQAKDILENYF